MTLSAVRFNGHVHVDQIVSRDGHHVGSTAGWMYRPRTERLLRVTPVDVLDSFCTGVTGIPASPDEELFRQASILGPESCVVHLEVLDLRSCADEILLKAENGLLQSFEVLGTTLCRSDVHLSE